MGGFLPREQKLHQTREIVQQRINILALYAENAFLGNPLFLNMKELTQTTDRIHVLSAGNVLNKSQLLPFTNGSTTLRSLSRVLSVGSVLPR